MRILEFVGPVVLFIFLAFVFFTTTTKGRFIVCLFAVFWVIFHLYCEFNYRMDPLQYIGAKSSYCWQRPASFACLTGGEFERHRRSELETAPSDDICRACRPRRVLVDRPVTEYVRLNELQLGRNNLQQILNQIGRPVAEVEDYIRSTTGASFRSWAAETVNLQAGALIVYSASLGRDDVFGEIVHFREGCLLASTLYVGVMDGRVQTINWIGTLDKNCFDSIWLPAVARWRSYRMDEQFRSWRQIATAVRFYDEPNARIILISSRSPNPDKQRVGLRIAVEGAGVTALVDRYEENRFKAYYMGTETIALQ